MLGSIATLSAWISKYVIVFAECDGNHTTEYLIAGPLPLRFSGLTSTQGDEICIFLLEILSIYKAQSTWFRLVGSKIKLVLSLKNRYVPDLEYSMHFIVRPYRSLAYINCGWLILNR